MSELLDLPQPRSGGFRAEVAARLRQSIAARNVKKSAVAEAIGMNLTSFSKRVNGRLAVDVDEVDVIADVIGVYRDWLLTGNGSMLDPEWVPPAGFEPAAFRSEDLLVFPQDGHCGGVDAPEHDWLAPVVPIGTTVVAN